MAGSEQANGHDHDDWFRHEASEGVPQAEHAAYVPSKALGIAFLTIVFGVVAVVLGLSLYFDIYTTNRKAEAVEGPHPDRGEYLSQRAAAQATLRSAGWVNRAEGVTHIPIERSMGLVAREYAGPQED